MSQTTPAKPSPLYESHRLNLSKFLLDVKHFSSKDEQTKAEDMYKQLMEKEKELKDMLKEKVPVSDMPGNFTLKDFTDQVKTNSLTKALKLHFSNGRNDKAAWDYLTLTQSAMELVEHKNLTNRKCCVTSAQTSFRKCVFCENNAVFFCYQCKAAFCPKCRANYHDKLPVSKDHSVIDLKSVNPSAVQLVCSVHKSEYTYYCVSCKTLVCSTCVTTAHTGHDMSEIKQKAEEIKKIARSKSSDMKEKLQRLSKLVEITKTVHIPHVDEESVYAIESIRTIKTDLDNIIQRKTEIKFNEIEDSQHLKKEELQSTYHNKRRTLKKQTAVYESLETLLSEEHAVSFLVSYQTLESEMFDLTGDILEDAEPNNMKPPDLVAFLDDIVYSIQEYKKGMRNYEAE